MAGSSIPLHPEKGVNPRLTFCPNCGGEGREIMLIGNREKVYKCAFCHVTIFGHRQSEPCPKCKDLGPHEFVRKIEDEERLPGGLCEACEKEKNEHDAVVAAGGIHFKCASCKITGVIKASSELAKTVREHHQKQGQNLVKGWFTEPIHTKGNSLVYMPCGVEMNSENCPKCRPNKEEG